MPRRSKRKKGGAGAHPRLERSDLRLAEDVLRWRCDPKSLGFRSSAEVEPINAVVGQDDAVEALRFGLESKGAGQNVYIRGLTGTGRMTLVRQLVEEISPQCRPPSDRCYVHDFAQPDRPRLITLPHGDGRPFTRRVERLIEFIVQDLSPLLSSDRVRARRKQLDERAEADIKQIGQPLEREMQESELALAPIQIGQTIQPAVLPVIDGKPVPLERFQQLRADGQIPEERAEAVLRRIESFQKRILEVGQKIRDLQEKHRSAIHELYESEARASLAREINEIEKEFPHEAVRAFLKQVVEDLVSKRLRTITEDQEFVRQYRVNLVVSHEKNHSCPIVVENSPTLQNLLGHVDRQVVAGGLVHTDHTMIRAGSLARADGGFLIMEARDVLGEPGAWRALVRTLRTGKLEIVPTEMFSFWAGPSLKPESIDVDLKVVLIGDPGLYYLLDSHDHDFPHLFKVLSDFDVTIDRDERGVSIYAGWLAKLAKEEELPPFSRDGVAALVEHGARIAARRGRLTTRFGRLADIAREASHFAGKRNSKIVEVDDVRGAVAATKRRADLPARQFRRLVAERMIRIQLDGAEVGQVNGLAVIHAGLLTYGFPSRITATIGPGTAGTINIERESQLSGAIHTKGFYILGGLLRHLLKVEHPLAFSASIAFEQSYGGIDGDSASGAEVCCLLSALTDIPLRQDLAMTGAIDQLGHILPVGAVTEKAEGFFDICNDLGLTGSQGLIVPRANAEDMMLRQDVVDACGKGEFHVYAVDTIHEALELLTGRPAGEQGADGHYTADTVLGAAEVNAYKYWKLVSASGTRPPNQTENEKDV
ncbi:MAG: AAA family ATPase [Acidobacteriota bacterium]|nr:AAA family ATPase [Acidobacteriota bacterium]